MSWWGQMRLASGGSGGAATTTRTLRCGTYSFTVGAGGVSHAMLFQSLGSSYNVIGENGGQTTFGDISVSGGGGGSAFYNYPMAGSGGTGMLNGYSGNVYYENNGDEDFFFKGTYSAKGAPSRIGTTSGSSSTISVVGNPFHHEQTQFNYPNGNSGCVIVEYVGPDE